MLGRLFLLFTVVPLLELALLIEIGEWAGALPTVGLVAATGIAGAWLARRESTRSWRAVRRELSAGRVPGEELLHTLLIVLAGALLVTPGVVTDAVGLLTLARPVRSLAVDLARKRLARSLEEGSVRIFQFGTSSEGAPFGEPAAPPKADEDEDDGADGWRRRPPSPGAEDGGGGSGDDSPGRVVDV